MAETRSEYSEDELEILANQANIQYLDLEGAENELSAWIRSANRGPQGMIASTGPQAHSGTVTPALPPPTWDTLFHPQTHQPQPHYPQPHQLLTMNQKSDSQYHYHQDPSQPQTYYQPPPTSPPPRSPSQAGYQPYYHTQPFPSPSLTSPSLPPSNPYEFPGYPSRAFPSPTPSSSADPELKRIRNTAASARFRAKKKRREASLERNAKEKREALQKLEDRIQELEAENRFLKGLIFETGKGEGVERVENELERVRALKREMEMAGAEEERDDGVGT